MKHADLLIRRMAYRINSIWCNIYIIASLSTYLFYYCKLVCWWYWIHFLRSYCFDENVKSNNIHLFVVLHQYTPVNILLYTLCQQKSLVNFQPCKRPLAQLVELDCTYEAHQFCLRHSHIHWAGKDHHILFTAILPIPQIKIEQLYFTGISMWI